MKNRSIQKNDGMKMVGTITVRAYKAGTKDLLQQIVQKNLIMTGTNTGRDLIVQRLIGTVTYSTIINYGAIGTGSTAPAASDTQLVAETARTTVAFSQDVSNSQATIQFFFADASLANGTYREFGTFVDGTASANTGKIFNRALFSSAYIKAAGTDTTVEVDITLS